MKKVFVLSTFVFMAFCGFTQNVGIGTPTPGFPLDINGRVRVQHKGNQTAGIWYDGVTQPARSFIGTINDSTVGIFGAVSGWKFSMNVLNGNVGVGTLLPTTELDVNGALRLRGNTPVAGASLVSKDALGNATWQHPVAFKAAGLKAATSFNSSIVSQLEFNIATVYNSSLTHYDPFASMFYAPENGIYHFDLQAILNIAAAEDSKIYLRMSIIRGTESFIAASTYQTVPYVTGATAVLQTNPTIRLSTDIRMVAGDKLFAEIYKDGATSYDVSTAAADTWFNGHLVTRF
ncbi:MAG: hypothetical protein V4722_12390 [Bacteroidota bacterium]